MPLPGYPKWVTRGGYFTLYPPLVEVSKSVITESGFPGKGDLKIFRKFIYKIAYNSCL
jgi:hypothetical protein